jgi:hypothetical protein
MSRASLNKAPQTVFKIGMVAGDKAGKLNVLRLSLEDGQAYEFHRE